MAYSDLPSDVEIVENEEGWFEPRSPGREVPHISETSREAARRVCLTYLNVWAAKQRVDDLLRGADVYGPSRYTRVQYERACDELGLIRLPDSVCQTLPRFRAPEHDAETIVIGSLAMSRRSGMIAEGRRQRQAFEEGLKRLPGFSSRGLSREQYERACVWVGAEPAPEEQIAVLKVQCFQQEETADTVDLPLILAKWRDTGRYYERQAGA